jgi:uncharacterized protein YggU (UPF0235/DUF167 family)
MVQREYHLHNGKKGAALTVRVTTRANKDEIVEILQDGTIRIRLNISPTEVLANQALKDYLAKVLNIPKSNIEIVAGLTGRDKLVSILDMDAETVQFKILEHVS